jgi:hypothetical protein
MLGNNFKAILKEERWSKLPTFTVYLCALRSYFHFGDSTFKVALSARNDR